MEMLLTVEQAAARLQLSVLTVRRQLARGALRGVKRGRVWRVPESALTESAPATNDWTAAGNAAANIYAHSLTSDGDLTAITNAEGGFHEGHAA